MRDLNDINRLIAITEAELSELNTRRSELIARVAELQREKAALLQPIASSGPDDSQPIVTNQSSQEEKLALFNSLFRGRDDLYPRRVRWGLSSFLKRWSAGRRLGCTPMIVSFQARIRCPEVDLGT